MPPPARSPRGVVDRLARAGVSAAARRWPPEIADAMRDEWLAELAALDAAGLGIRAYRKLVFAGSLLLSPAVDEPPWRDRAAALGRSASVAAGVTLLAAALVNAVRAAGALAPLQLAVAVAVCLAIGFRVRTAAVPVGGAVFAFLLAGNAVPVMPFMGFADIAPAVLTWTLLTAVIARCTTRLAAAGRRRRAALVAVGGGAAALDLATVAGSVHAAAVLGVPAVSAPAWFPLALVPGGTAGFGPHFADGTATFGSLQAVGPAFHASDILLANAAVMAGPLLLCTVAVLASAFRHAVAPGSPPARLRTGRQPERTHLRTGGQPESIPLRTGGQPESIPLRTGGQPESTPLRTGGQPGSVRRLRAGGLQVAAGIAAALGGLAVCHVLMRSTAAADVTLHRMLENSTVFGFGFVAHPAGRGAVALLAAVLVMRAVEAMPTRRG
jgi:hypothetical protein